MLVIHIAIMHWFLLLEQCNQRRKQNCAALPCSSKICGWTYLLQQLLSLVPRHSCMPHMLSHQPS